MVIEELYIITQWVQKEIVNSGLVNCYQNLINILSQNIEENRERLPFENEKEQVLNIVKSIKTKILNEEQKDFLMKLNLYQNVAEEGLLKMENILFRNSLDIVTLRNKLNQSLSEINYAVQRIEQIGAGLGDLIDFNKEQLKTEPYLQLNFKGNSSISNIAEFKTWIENWYEVLRGAAMLHGETPENILITDAKGSAITISLKASREIIETVKKINVSVLEIIEKIVEIKKKTEEIRSMNLMNKQIEFDLEREADRLRKESIEKIGKEITLNKGANGEVQRNIEKSIRIVFDFIENGGEIDSFIPLNLEESFVETENNG